MKNSKLIRVPPDGRRAEPGVPSDRGLRGPREPGDPCPAGGGHAPDAASLHVPRVPMPGTRQSQTFREALETYFLQVHKVWALSLSALCLKLALWSGHSLVQRPLKVYMACYTNSESYGPWLQEVRTGASLKNAIY